MTQTENLWFSRETIEKLSQENGCPTEDVLTELHRIQNICERRIWDCRDGKDNHSFVVYDSSQSVILGFENVGEINEIATSSQSGKTAIDCHSNSIQKYFSDSLEFLDSEELLKKYIFLLVKPSETKTWNDYCRENNQWYSPIEYNINFSYPKWDTYKKSAYASLILPSVSGTLKTEYVIQGFPNNREQKGIVRIKSSVTHCGTNNTITRDSEEFFIPNIDSIKFFPFIRPLQNVIYNYLFKNNPFDYKKLLNSNISTCDLCGKYKKRRKRVFKSGIKP